MIISSSPHFPFAYPTQYHGYRIYDTEYQFRRFTFAFKTKANIHYIIEIEEFQNKIFILKFYPKSLKQSKNRFKILTNKHDAFRILATTMNVLIYIKSEIDSKASFGFVGAPKLDIEKDHNNTQRFRIYIRKSQRYFNPKNYIHVANQLQSTYLILDRTVYTEEDIEPLNEKFKEYYTGLN